MAIMRKTITLAEQQFRGCNAIMPSDLNRAMAEMQYSLGDYTAAAKARKRVAVALFGGNGRRCIAERVMRRL